VTADRRLETVGSQKTNEATFNYGSGEWGGKKNEAGPTEKEKNNVASKRPAETEKESRKKSKNSHFPQTNKEKEAKRKRKVGHVFCKGASKSVRREALFLDKS